MKKIIFFITLSIIIGCKTMPYMVYSGIQNKFAIENMIEETYSCIMDDSDNAVIDNNSLSLKKDFKYNRDGNLFQEIYLEKDERQRMKIAYFYNSKKVLIENRVYNKDNELVAIEKYKYENKLLTKTEEFNTQGELLRIKQFEYDSTGILTSRKLIRKDGTLIDKTTYVVAKDYELKILFDANNKEIFRIETKFDSNGDFEEIKTIYPSGYVETNTYSYKYNDKGLWIEQKITSKPFETIFFKIRSYTFFN